MVRSQIESSRYARGLAVLVVAGLVALPPRAVEAQTWEGATGSKPAPASLFTPQEASWGGPSRGLAPMFSQSGTLTPPVVRPLTGTFRGSRSRKVVLGIAGGLAGAIFGTLVGVALDSNCGCDDPGLRGLIIGLPAGAAAGAVVAIKVFR